MRNSEEEKKSESMNQDPDSKDEFIRETVLNREADLKRRKNLLFKIIGIVLGAVLFGAIASLVFVMLVPRIQEKIQPAPEETEIVIPDDAETESSVEETTEAIDSEEKIEEMVDSAVSSRTWDVSDYNSLLQTMTASAVEANKGIVTVYVSTPEKDIFDNTVEHVGQTSGAIWSITDTELLILTTAQKVEGDSVVEVQFCNSSESPAIIKASDSTTGISVVSVSKDDVDDATFATLKALPLGNSLTTGAGTGIICVGSPEGYVGSINYGIISYVRGGVMSVDMEEKIFTMSFATGDAADGFIVGLDGNIIGVILPGMSGTMTQAVGISDLKPTIEMLANGRNIAYLGVNGLDVTTSVSEKNNVPKGVYISEIPMDSPAFEIGLQVGDIITSVGDITIGSVKDLEGVLVNCEPEEQVTVTVMRSDKDTYAEMKFDVTLGQR